MRDKLILRKKKQFENHTLQKEFESIFISYSHCIWLCYAKYCVYGYVAEYQMREHSHTQREKARLSFSLSLSLHVTDSISR